MGLALTLLAFVVALGPLVALHEWGHFIVARLCGVKVLAFSVGFGPVLWSTTDKHGTEYRLSAVPLGGYVKMLDEREQEVAPELADQAFNNKTALQKIAVVAAGPLMNFVIAVALFFVLALPAKQVLVPKVATVVANTPAAGVLVEGDLITKVDSKDVDNWTDVSRALIGRMGETTLLHLEVERAGERLQLSAPITEFMKADAEADPLQKLGALPYQPPIRPLLSQVDPKGPAAAAGLKEGDLIVSVGGVATEDWSDVTKQISQSNYEPLSVVVLRDKAQLTMQITPAANRSGSSKRPYLGVGVQPDIQIPDQYLKTQKLSVGQALAEGVTQTYELSALTLNGMAKILKGLIGLENISGPVTIASVAGQTMNLGWQPFLGFIAFMSVALAVLNLLPVPVLDGGHIVIHAVEGLIGKPIPERMLTQVSLLGLWAVLSLMVLALYNDFTRFF